IFRSLGKPANLAGRIVRPHRNRLAHGKPPQFAILNHAAIDSGIPRESATQRLGISRSRLVADHSIAAAERSIAGAEHSRVMDHSIAGAERSIAGTERKILGMRSREGSRVSSRHVLVSLASSPQRSSLRQSEAFSWHLSFWRVK